MTDEERQEHSRKQNTLQLIWDLFQSPSLLPFDGERWNLLLTVPLPDLERLLQKLRNDARSLALNPKALIYPVKTLADAVDKARRSLPFCHSLTSGLINETR